MALQVELVAPDRLVWSGEARIVIARTAEGDIGVLSGHAPVLGVLVEGPVQIRAVDGETVVAAVHGGFFSVANDKISILAELAEVGSEIDTERARRALESTGSAGADDEDAQAAARRARSRLRAAEMSR